MQLVHDEAERQARLDRMKRRATGLLALATIIFAISRILESTYHWLAPIRATAEAAMVGGLADWFAVTALFRHPLGIPIPHTAIVPNRKDRVGRTLGAFVQKNFLTREVIGGKLQTLRSGERLARWIADPENARTIARHAATSLSAAAQVLRDEDVQALIDRGVESRVRETRVGPLVGKVLSVVTEGNRHQELLNEAIKLMARAVDENTDIIRNRIEEESPWWVPTAVDDKIYRKVITAIGNTLVEIRDDPYHPLRARFDQALREFIDSLQTSPETIARAESLKQEMLGAEAVRRFSSSLWVDAKAALLRYAENKEGKSWGTIERALNAFGETILADPALMQKIDDFVVEAAVFLVHRYQDEVADLIAQTVRDWDPDVTTKRVELAIGRDLQFIRINGTIVGGLAGLALYFISKLLP
jgi:uncharacterized membrane-anchored protein YjiN (DUF445 family)